MVFYDWPYGCGMRQKNPLLRPPLLQPHQLFAKGMGFGSRCWPPKPLRAHQAHNSDHPGTCPVPHHGAARRTLRGRLTMAVNKPVEDNARKGAVKKRRHLKRNFWAISLS
jgi:hypothetical protein